MTNEDWADDERLFGSLRRALREAEEVPPRFVEVGRAAFAWHTIDAELADLRYDSSSVAEPAGAVRAEDASLRSLTYATAHLTIEIELTTDALLGQVLPPQAGRATTYLASGPVTEVNVDEMGFFAIRPAPRAAFRLRCVTRSGLDVKTGLIRP